MNHLASNLALAAALATVESRGATLTKFERFSFDRCVTHARNRLAGRPVLSNAEPLTLETARIWLEITSKTALARIARRDRAMVGA